MSIAINSLRTYIFRIATGIIGFLIGVFLARFLGPTGKGAYQGIFLFYGVYVAVFGNLGGAIVYQLARLKRPPRALLVNASLYSLLIGLLTVGAFWLYTVFNPRFHAGYLWFVIFVIPFVLVLSNINGIFQGLNRITTLNWIGIASGLLQLLILSIGLLGLSINVRTAVMIWLAAQSLTILGGLWVSREYWLPPLRGILNLPLLLSMVGFGWQLGLNTLVTYLNSRIDSILLLSYLGRRELGLYSVAVNGAEILWYATGAIAVAISARVGMAEKSQAGHLTARAVRHTILINIPLALIMWSAAWLIPLIYDNRYAPAMLPFRILLPGILAYSVAGIFSTYFTNQLGKPKIPLLIAFISMLIDAGACLLFIPRFGMAGAALANTISYIVSIGILIGLFCKETGMTPLAMFRINRDDVADYQQLFSNLKTFLHRKLGRS